MAVSQIIVIEKNLQRHRKKRREMPHYNITHFYIREKVSTKCIMDAKVLVATERASFNGRLYKFGNRLHIFTGAPIYNNIV